MKTKHKHKKKLKTKVKTKKKTKYMKLQGSITMSTQYHSEGPDTGRVGGNFPLTNFDTTSALTAAQIVQVLRATPSDYTLTASGNVGSTQLPDAAAVKAYLDQHTSLAWVGSGTVHSSRTDTLTDPQTGGNGTFYIVYTVLDNTMSGTITL